MLVRQRFGRSIVSLSLGGAVAGLIGCAAPAATTPAPAAGPVAVPAESRLRPTDPPADLGPVERYAWRSVVQLGDALASGDVNGFLGRVSRGFYRGYPALEQALQALVGATTRRSVVVAVNRVTVEEERVSVRARWERSATGADGVPRARAGETEFLFLKSETSLRLIDFRGDAPFGIEGVPALP